MLSLTLVAVLAGIGAPQGVHLVDAPVLMTEAPVSVAQLQVDLDALKRLRPSLGGGVALVIVGGSGALLGGLFVALALSFGSVASSVLPILVLGVVGLAIGLPLAVIGTWLLINRVEERGRIDALSATLRVQLLEQRAREQRQPFSLPALPPQVLGPLPDLVLARF